MQIDTDDLLSCVLFAHRGLLRRGGREHPESASGRSRGADAPLLHRINRASMWGALLAVNIAGWTHQLTATPGPGGQLLGHGVREGQAMITTLRHRLIRVPARLVRHAGALTLRLPPGHHLLAEVLARLRALPATS